MQNTIKKLRQSSIVFEKPGILPENLTIQLSYNSTFFAEVSHAFSAYQCLQKYVCDFFNFI